MVKKIKMDVKADCFNPRNPISIMGFLSTFKLSCNISRIHEGASMWVFPFFVENALATSLNSGISAATRIKLIVAS